MPPRTAAPRMPRATQGTIYRKGQAPKGATAAAPDSDDSDAEELVKSDVEEAEHEEVRGKDGLVIRREPATAVPLKVKELDLKPRLVTRPIEDDVKPSSEAKAAATKEESSEYETDSEEESSEEEAPKPLYKPVFVAKRNRETVPLDSEAQRIQQEEADERERQARIKASHDLVGQALEREMAEKEKPDTFPDVDDTDGLDPEREFEDWSLREMKRIKRDQEALYRREEEREEVERRRAMPEQLRLKEDLEHAQRTRDGKQRGQQVFLQKYHHKGVFYTDDEIMSRDYTAPTEGTIMDMSALPKAMQNRKFGKRSQSKYTHLRDQDTSKDDAGWAKKGGVGGSSSFKQGDPGAGAQSGCFQCGGDHLKRDCPQLRDGGGPSQSGANAGARDGGWAARVANDPRRDDERGRDSGGGGYRRERARSGTRDRSLERDRADRDKRTRFA